MLGCGSAETGRSRAVSSPPVDSGFAALLGQYDLLETVAGTGRFGDRGHNGWESRFEGGPAIEAELSRPHTTLADAAGHLYVADKEAHAIRRISPDGIITTVAGTSASGFDGDEPLPATENDTGYVRRIRRR